MNSIRFLFAVNVVVCLAHAPAVFCQPIKQIHSMSMQALSPNLGVKDVDKTVQFYHDLLGFELVTSVPAKTEGKPLDWAFVKSGPATLMFQQEQNLKNEYKNLASHPVGGAFTLYLTVTDFERIYEKAKTMTTILIEPHKTFYGAMEFALKDLDGYTLTLAEGAK